VLKPSEDSGKRVLFDPFIEGSGSFALQEIVKVCAVSSLVHTAPVVEPISNHPLDLCEDHWDCEVVSFLNMCFNRLLQDTQSLL